MRLEHIDFFHALDSVFQNAKRWAFVFLAVSKWFLSMLSSNFSSFISSHNVFIQNKQVTYYTPPRFPIHVIKSIREEASLLFQKLGLRDFARIDGWYLAPTSNLSSSASETLGGLMSRDIIFTDINLVSQLQSFGLSIYLYFALLLYNTQMHFSGCF